MANRVPDDLIERYLTASLASAEAIGSLTSAGAELRELARDIAGARDGSAYQMHLLALERACVQTWSAAAQAYEVAATARDLAFSDFIEWLAA